MEIIEMKAKKISAGPGSWAFVAEAVVATAGQADAFVTVQDYDGMTEYTVSEKSVYAFLAEDTQDGNSSHEDDDLLDMIGQPVPEGQSVIEFREKEFEAFEKAYLERHPEQNDEEENEPFREEYKKLTDAKKSTYGTVFALLRKMVNGMEKA